MIRLHTSNNSQTASAKSATPPATMTSAYSGAASDIFHIDTSQGRRPTVRGLDQSSGSEGAVTQNASRAAIIPFLPAGDDTTPADSQASPPAFSYPCAGSPPLERSQFTQALIDIPFAISKFLLVSVIRIVIFASLFILILVSR